MSLLEALRDAVGTDHVLVDPDLRAAYETDWTGAFHGSALAVVRPASTTEVASVVRACARYRTPVQVQGGNTGLVGGSVPSGGEVLLSTTRLAGIEEVDSLTAQVTVGAGVTLSALRHHVARAGHDLGVDLAARDSATVGGMAATNAGGVQVIRHGSMRTQVIGLEAVLADGSVVSRLGSLAKDNAGYDLASLLCGSEGTLGVITRVRMRLVPRLAARAVAVVALADVGAAVAALPALRARLPHLSAAEVFFAEGLSLVRATGHLPALFRVEHPCYLLLECAGLEEDVDDLFEALVEVLDALEGLQDAVVATDAAGRRRLWAYREGHTEAVAAAGVPVKLDVSVPVRELPALVDRLAPAVSDACPGARVVVFGHLGEGNLHVNVLGADHVRAEVTHAVLAAVADLGGSISSEHGVGRAKAAWLGLSRSPTEIAAMRAIRAAWDPAGLLNPGVLFAGRNADGGDDRTVNRQARPTAPEASARTVETSPPSSHRRIRHAC